MEVMYILDVCRRERGRVRGMKGSEEKGSQGKGAGRMLEHTLTR